MINLTKMNLNRMFYNKLFYILMIINFGICILIASLEADPVNQELDQQIMAEQGIDPSEDDTGFGMTVGGNITEETPLEDIYAEMVGCGLILTLVGVFASVYSDEERKSGFLKNLTVGKNGKKYVFASKASVLFIFCFLQMMIGFVATQIGSNLTGHYGIVNLGNLVFYILVETLLHTAFGLFIMAFYEIFRNVVFNILVAVFASLNLFGFIFSLLETKLGVLRMIAEAFGGRFEIVQYMLVTRIRNMQVNESVFPFVPSIVVALVGLTLYLVLGMVIHSKRDTI